MAQITLTKPNGATYTVDDTWLGLSGLLASGWQMPASSTPAVPTPPTTNNQLAQIQTGYKIPTTDYSARLAELSAKASAAQASINSARQTVLNALNPTAQETQGMTDLAAKQKQIRDLGASTQMGVDIQSGQPIPMPLITGQNKALIEQSSRQSTQLTNEANTISDMLKTFQTARQGTLTRAQTELGFYENDLASALDMSKYLVGLQKEERDYANQILEFAVNSYAGIPSNELDEATRANLQQLADQTGMPLDLILRGIDSATSKLKNDYQYFTNEATGDVTVWDPQTKTTVSVIAGAEQPRPYAGSGGGSGSSSWSNATGAGDEVLLSYNLAKTAPVGSYQNYATQVLNGSISYDQAVSRLAKGIRTINTARDGLNKALESIVGYFPDLGAMQRQYPTSMFR